jgi:type I restriction enzyme S subunit
MQGAKGTKMPRGDRNQIMQWPILIPSKNKQHTIASILYALDDKIEVNRRINDNLEQQAQALFKSWFVDFEPFKDGGFVESELGMIPKGWRAGTLSEIANITMGTSPSGASYNVNGEGEVFYQGRAEFGYRFPHRNMYTTEPKRYAEDGDVLLSVRAPVGDVNIANERCCIGRGLAAIGSESCPSYILYLVKSLKSVFEQYNGEGTVFGSINKKTLEGLRIIVPESKYIERFEKVANTLDGQIRCKEEESRRLASLRDTLLPKLMSGELKLNEVNV